MGKPKKQPSKHTAAGPAAGYFFQPERALKWLADAPSEAKVGIETDDDIAVAVRNRVLVREQDKHSITGKHPFGNHSPDLWKSLLIWLDGAKAGEFDPATCKLFFATNTTVGDCFLRSLIGCNGKPKQIKKQVDILLVDTFPDGVLSYVKRFKKHDPKLVYAVLAAIELIDSNDASAGDKLRAKAASVLHLPDDLDHDVILNGLLGWIHQQTLQAWRDGKPAWIERSAFDRQLHRLLRLIRYYTKYGLPAHLVNVSRNEARKELDKLFVKQLRLIEASDEEVWTAIDDYCRCRSEKIRLANEGDLTHDDWISFDEILLKHWQLVSGLERRSARSALEQGYTVYSTVMRYEAKLAQEDAQPYMTSGTYHRMANDLRVGWHPEFQTLCTK